MKKLLSTILILLMAIPAVKAQSSDRPLLRVRLSDHSPVALAVDGRYYRKHGPTLTIGNLPQGKHYVKVYAYTSGRHRGLGDLVYAGRVYIKRGTFNVMTVNPQNGVMRLHTRNLQDEDFKHRHSMYDHDFNGNDKYHDYSGNVDDNNYHADATNRQDGYSGAIPDNAVKQNDIDDLNKEVSNRITDTGKLKLMESVLKTRSYYTDQVRIMLKWLSFESSRLDFAKWAYGHTIDKQNYWKLESDFTFTSSKDDLQSFIKSAR